MSIPLRDSFGSMCRLAGAASLLMFAGVTSCSITAATARSDDERELLRNRQRWVGAGIHDYEFEFRRVCFCLPEATEPVRITVRNDVVTSVVRMRDGQPASANVASWPTVDSLFADVQRSIDQNAERLDVDYDATYGYPRSVVVDALAAMVDDEYFLSAANLRRLP
jgi:hypothetical protein